MRWLVSSYKLLLSRLGNAPLWKIAILQKKDGKERNCASVERLKEKKVRSSVEDLFFLDLKVVPVK